MTFYSCDENEKNDSKELHIEENPHLKNIDPKMIEMIKNEIIECIMILFFFCFMFIL